MFHPFGEKNPIALFRYDLKHIGLKRALRDQWYMLKATIRWFK